MVQYGLEHPTGHVHRFLAPCSSNEQSERSHVGHIEDCVWMIGLLSALKGEPALFICLRQRFEVVERLTQCESDTPMRREASVVRAQRQQSAGKILPVLGAQYRDRYDDMRLAHRDRRCV